MSFRGEVDVMALEPASRTVRLAGKGTDATGTSGASMDLTARVEAVNASSSRLLGSSEVTMSGKAAAFGARMMSSVADQVLKQFGDNFASQLRAMQPQTPAVPPQADAATPPGAHQLNGLALAWAVIKDWLRSLFRAKRA
jgi:hypothetical protein